jgi:ribosomal protein S18 acetylase RimI-like enzyme
MRILSSLAISIAEAIAGGGPEEDAGIEREVGSDAIGRTEEPLERFLADRGDRTLQAFAPTSKTSRGSSAGQSVRRRPWITLLNVVAGDGAMAEDVAIRRAVELRGAARDRFERIYEQSFPAEERDDTDRLLASVASGRHLCYVAEQGGVLVGLAVLLPLTGCRAQYLEYLAIDPTRRDRGLGARLLRDVRRLAEQAPKGPLDIVFEVEPPGDAQGPEQEIRRRRVAFYERQGASVVACAPCYRAPNLAGEGTLSLTLMWLPSPGTPSRLEGGRLRGCVHAILTQGYQLEDDNELLVEVLKQLRC